MTAFPMSWTWSAPVSATFFVPWRSFRPAAGASVRSTSRTVACRTWAPATRAFVARETPCRYETFGTDHRIDPDGGTAHRIDVRVEDLNFLGRGNRDRLRQAGPRLEGLDDAHPDRPDSRGGRLRGLGRLVGGQRDQPAAQLQRI